jgi:hypothetical protein
MILRFWILRSCELPNSPARRQILSRVLIIAIAFLGIVYSIGCSTAYDISYDFDRAADFSGLRTYDWLPEPEKSEMSDLDLRRIQRAVGVALKDKGFIKSTSNPDFLVASHLGTKDKVNASAWGYGYGPYRRYWGGYWGHGGVSVYQYEEGTLILDFVLPDSKNLIWRGTAKSVVDNANTPDKRDKLINVAVQKILQQFPPNRRK